MTQQTLMVKEEPRNELDEALKVLESDPKLLEKTAKGLEENPESKYAYVPLNGKLVPVPRNFVISLAEKEDLIPKVSREQKLKALRKRLKQPFQLPKQEQPLNTTVEPIQVQPQVTPAVITTTTQIPIPQPQVTVISPTSTIPQKQEVMVKRPSVISQAFQTLRQKLKRKPRPQQQEEQEFRILRPRRFAIPREEVIKKERIPLLYKETIREPETENENVLFGNYRYRYAPSVLDFIRNRFKLIYRPAFSDLYYQDFERNTFYRPLFAYRQKSIFKPKFSNSYYRDSEFEPYYTQIVSEDFAPKNKDYFTYNPQLVQEAYPTFTYATYGLPETEITIHEPQDKIKISPVTEFEINAKPSPLIVNQTYVSLLNHLMKQVTR
jgi:hypothetical protein